MAVKNFIFFIFFNILKPILLPIFRYFKVFNFAVLVYPGTKKDIATYVPFDALRIIFPNISIVGFIKKGSSKNRGIILGTKYYIEEIKEKKDHILKILEKEAHLLGVEKVALVGRLPKILFGSNRSLFVEGKDGTVFTVIDSVKTAILKLGLSYKNVNIGVIGVGFIGKGVLESLKDMGFNSIIGFDMRFEKKSLLEDKLKKGNDPALLKDCHVLVILTPSGDNVRNLIPFMKEGVIILDDTHPFMSKEVVSRIEQEKKGTVYKVAVELGGVMIFPKMRGFRNNWIPGCVVETMVALYDKKTWSGQIEFNQIAREIGFKAILEKSSAKNFIALK